MSLHSTSFTVDSDRIYFGCYILKPIGFFKITFTSKSNASHYQSFANTEKVVASYSTFTSRSVYFAGGQMGSSAKQGFLYDVQNKINWYVSISQADGLRLIAHSSNISNRPSMTDWIPYSVGTS